MKPELRNKLLLALALAADADDAAIETALSTHLDGIIAKMEKKEEETQGNPPTAPPAANAKLAADLTAAVNAANSQATALRELRVNLTLDTFTALGIITPASRETEKAALLAANDEAAFSSGLDALRARKPVMRMAPAIASGIPQDRQALLAANSDHGRAELRRVKIQECMNEITANRPRMAGDYERASAIAATRFPDLFSY